MKRSSSPGHSSICGSFSTLNGSSWDEARTGEDGAKQAKTLSVPSTGRPGMKRRGRRRTMSEEFSFSTLNGSSWDEANNAAINFPTATAFQYPQRVVLG